MRTPSTGETLRYFAGVHTKLGEAKSSTLQNITVNTNTNGNFLVTVYQSNFEKGTAIETFTWRKSDGNLPLNGCNIQSNPFILNLTASLAHV